ncbi:MAG: VTT domain-containing protein [Patescibacteria group bacterium]|nr:VTT domain-containing protein [Patescibacteria group bacterium]
MELFSADNISLIIREAGYILGHFLVAGIVFAETGLLLGFFLPGDSLLFVSGLLASQGYLNIYYIIPMIFIASIIGDNFGYFLGHKFGSKIFRKEKALILKKENTEKAREFYEKHGAKTMIVAKFIPFVRTFAPVFAGVGKMNYKIFFFFDLVGSLFWSLLIPLAGFYLGKLIPGFDKYILYIVLAIIVVSILPSSGILAGKHIKKKRKEKKEREKNI